MSLLPPELWDLIAEWTAASNHRPADYQQLLRSVDRQTSRLLQTPGARRRWLMNRMRQDSNEVLLFAYRHQLMDVAYAVIDSPIQLNNSLYDTAAGKIMEFSLAFTQIAMQVVPSDDWAAQQRKLSIIKRLLDSYAKSADSTDSDDNVTLISTSTHRHRYAVSPHELAVVALRWSTYYAEHAIVEYLLNDYGVVVNSFNCYVNWWIRMLNEERFDLLRLLIRHGARVTVAGETTNNNDDNEDLSTAGSISASLRRRQQASNDGILTIAETSNSMLYPLKAMAAAGNLKACRFLLNETPEFTATAAAADSSPGSLSKTGGSLLNKALYTALVTAAAYNKPQIIEMIAEEFPAYPAAIEDPNRDCLISAVYHNHFDCVRVIKQHYLPRDSIHCDHLLFAIRLSCSNREMLEMLLSVYQFAPGQEHLLLITELLEICCRRGHTDSAEWLTKTQTILSSTIIFDCIRLAAKAGHLATVDRAMQAMERRCTSAATDVTDDISRGSAVLTKYRLRLLAIMMRSIGVNANRDN